MDVMLWDAGRENGGPQREGEIAASSHLKVRSTRGLLRRQHSGWGTSRAVWTSEGGPGSPGVCIRKGFYLVGHIPHRLVL